MARQPPWVVFIGLVAYAATPPPSSMAALDPAVSISQYAHTAWRVRDGLLGSLPHAVGQTTDGYLWIGTDAGLVRFDGVRFVPWAPPPATPLPSSTVLSLLGAVDGSLWIGTAGGLAHWTNDRLETFPDVGGRVNAILEDDDGSIWIVRSRIAAVQGPQGPLCRFHQGALRCYGAAEGMACRVGTTLAKDASGAIWLGGSDALCRWTAGQATSFLQRELAPIQGTPGISSLAARTEGGVWVGTYMAGAALGLRRFVDGSWARHALPGMDGGTLKVSALQMDRNGSLWIGTTDEGLYRMAGGRAEHFRGADGLSSDTVSAFYQDREGSLWVVTSKGIDRLRDYRVMTHSSREGLTGDNVNSVLATADGTVWVGNVGALNALHGSKVSSMALRSGLPGANVTSLFEDRHGRMWVGVDNSLFAYEGGRFRPVKTRHGGTLGIVLAMTDDSDHNLWAEVAGARPGLVRIRDLEESEYVPLSAIPWVTALAPDPSEGIWLGLLDGNLGRYRRGRFETFSSHSRPTAGRIRGLLVEPDGAVWTTSPGGLTRWQGGVARTLDSRHGLPCDDVFTLIRDDRRALWLYTACGLVVIAGSELDRWSAGSSDTVEAKTFGVLDGAQPAPATFQPAAARSRDGRLWFANSSFLQSIDPGHLVLDSRPPAVHIEQFIADDRTYGARSRLQLPALTRAIQVDYSATGLVMPERAQFRYKLEGRDTDWQDPGTRRQAFYNDLPPGAYRFRVLASNQDGVWNESGARLDFVVAPAYYQTVWFRAGLVAIALAALWMLYRLRLRQLTTAAEARMETRLAERTRIAQDLHDTLLQGCLSVSMQLHVAVDQVPADTPGNARLRGVLDLMSRVIDEGRNAVRGLRAPESGSGDLEESFSRIRQELGIQDEIVFRVVGEGPPRALNPMIRDDVLRIGREAVVNAFRHSAGRRIDVAVERGRDVLRVRVLDDGCGMDPEILRAGRDGHWGLSGMRERAEQMGGALRVWSRPGAGTEVELSVPGHVAFPHVASRGALEWLRSLPRLWSKRIP